MNSLAPPNTSGYRKNICARIHNLKTVRFYDQAGRETGRVYANGSRVTTTYDDAGNRILVADSTGIYTRTYSPLDLTTSVANPDGNRLTFVSVASGAS